MCVCVRMVEVEVEEATRSEQLTHHTPPHQPPPLQAPPPPLAPPPAPAEVTPTASASGSPPYPWFHVLLLLVSTLADGLVITFLMPIVPFMVRDFGVAEDSVGKSHTQF